MNLTHQEQYNLNMNKTILGDCSHFTSTGQFFCSVDNNFVVFGE